MTTRQPKEPASPLAVVVHRGVQTMRILLVHNRYLLRGGEEVVFENERDLLRTHNHETHELVLDNTAIQRMWRIELAMNTVWSRRLYAELRARIRRLRPDIVHFHNTLPLVSPAGYHAAHAEGVPVVQTLHNYRLICPGALLLRGGSLCEDCVGLRFPWPALVHGCYRQSRTATAVVIAMLQTHRWIGTWQKVDAYIALTEFARSRFIAGGLPALKIVVKPNFTFPCASSAPASHPKDYFLFVGRVSHEKGLSTLLDAWERANLKSTLVIVGDGPDASALRGRSGRVSGVDWRGALPLTEVQQLMKGARALVFPSICYEGGVPLVIVEAFAAGLPVIASAHGSMPEIVTHERTGLLVPAKDPTAWSTAMNWMMKEDGARKQMAANAQGEFEARYSPESNLKQLIGVYVQAISNHGKRV